MVTIRRLARKPYKLLAEQHSKLYGTLEKQAKESIAKQQQKQQKQTAGAPAENKLTNGCETTTTGGGSDAGGEPMDNEDVSSSSTTSAEKKAVSTGAELNGTDVDKPHTGSVVVLD